MVQTPPRDVVSTVKQHAKRFAKTYLAVADLAFVGWLVLSVGLLTDWVFDVVMGPLLVVSLIERVVTSSTLFGGAIVVFVAGMAFERYR